MSNPTPRPLGELPVGAMFGVVPYMPADGVVLRHTPEFTVIADGIGAQRRYDSHLAVYPNPTRTDR